MSANDAARIARALRDMSDDPLSGDIVKLKGTEAFRRRVGDYRILFAVDFLQRAVAVLDILRRTTTTYR
jgi:mRNA-degrading endonuclease RelE of RelBE toxin-antitoxin system